MVLKELSVSSDAHLHAALRERDAIIEAQQQTIIALRDTVRVLKKDQALLRREITRLLSHKKEGHLIEEGQLTLFGDKPEQEDEPKLEHLAEAPDGETRDDSIKNRHKPKRRSREIDLSALPREQVVHELPEDERVCPQTGQTLVPVGQKVFEEIDFVAAQLKVVEHCRIEYGLAPEEAQERQAENVVAAMPPRPLGNCKASASLLAQVLVQKYRFHLPLYRQEEVFQQAGLSIPRQTLCDWVMGVAFELSPIARELMRQIRAGPVLQLDDTPVKCRGPKGSGYFRACLWAFVNPEVEGVVYRFTPSRKAEEIEPLIDGLEGYLVGDGYSGHFSAAAEVPGIQGHGGCWSHALRKFRDAKKEGGRMAGMYMSDIAELFAVEEEATEAKMDAEARLQLRRERCRPVLARLLRRTRGWEEMFSASGKMGEAIKYMRNQWKALKCLLEDGRVPIHNNACELAIRTIAVGRRNWLFAGSERGGEAAAIAYTLITSCLKAGANPYEYVKDVLVRVGSHPASEIADLVPARWEALRASASAEHSAPQ